MASTWWSSTSSTTPAAANYCSNKYGLRKVPVLAKGDQYALGQMLGPFAKLAGLPMPGADRLSPSSSTANTKWCLPRRSVMRDSFPPTAFASA